MKPSLIASGCLFLAFSLTGYAAPGQSNVQGSSPKKLPTHVTPNKVNLNRAGPKDLTHLIKGIGKKRAEEIIKYRDAHGPLNPWMN